MIIYGLSVVLGGAGVHKVVGGLGPQPHPTTMRTQVTVLCGIWCVYSVLGVLSILGILGH